MKLNFICTVVAWRSLQYTDVAWRSLQYMDVAWRSLQYMDVAWRSLQYMFSLEKIFVSNVCLKHFYLHVVHFSLKFQILTKNIVHWYKFTNMKKLKLCYTFVKLKRCLTSGWKLKKYIIGSLISCLL